MTMSVQGNNRIRCIVKDLTSDENDALKFLLADLLHKPDLEKDISAKKIFGILEERSLVSESSPMFLIECLQNISRGDLVHKYFEDEMRGKEGIVNTGKISPYRLALFNVAVDLDTEDVDNLKCWKKEILKKTDRERIKNAFDLFVILEKKDKIRENDTKYLQEALKASDRDDLLSNLQELPCGRSPGCVPSAQSPTRSASHAHSTSPRNTRREELSDADITSEFDRCLRNKIITGIYKGKERINLTKTPRHVLEIKDASPDIIRGLKHFKQKVKISREIWVCFSDPEQDDIDYDNPWNCSLWFLNRHFKCQTPDVGEQCTVKLSDIQIYRPENPKARNKIVNFICQNQAERDGHDVDDLLTVESANSTRN